MPGSVRDYAILWVGARTGAGEGAVALGGNALLRTAQHKLDGVEHLAADDTTRLDSSIDSHGLMPKLSGDAFDVFHGDGSQAPVAAAEVTYDPTASALVAVDVQDAIDELAARTFVAALDDLTDVVITAPAMADRLRYNGADWVNSTLTWEPMVDGAGLVMLDGLGNIMRHEVAY